MRTSTGYNKAVIAEWSRRCRVQRTAMRKYWVAFWIVSLCVALPVVFGIIPPFPFLLAAVFCMVAGAVLVAFRYQQNIHCPSCGETPVGPLKALPIGLVDSCPHCNTWLVDPRRGTEA